MPSLVPSKLDEEEEGGVEEADEASNMGEKGNRMVVSIDRESTS